MKRRHRILGGCTVHKSVKVAKCVLAPREVEVLQCAANGLGRKDTADVFGVSVGYVKNVRHEIIWKLDAFNLAHAVAIGIKGKIIK